MDATFPLNLDTESEELKSQKDKNLGMLQLLQHKRVLKIIYKNKK